MSSWIDEAAQEVEREEREMAEERRRSYIVSNNVNRFWDDLRRLVEQDISAINSNDKFKGHPWGNLNFREMSPDIFEVSRGDDVRLRVKHNKKHLAIDFTRHAQGDDFTRLDDKEPERLDFTLDVQEVLCVQTKDGHLLHIGEVSRYLLKPLVVSRR